MTRKIVLPDSALRSLAFGYIGLSSFNLFCAISSILSRSPKFIVPVGQVFTQAGSKPSLIRLKHMLHFAIICVFSSHRGISHGQDSLICLKSAAFTLTFGS